ncbi:type II secretion system F family protein [Embleya sp. NPDC008237]|uniref:type II secretion system F family protein n=1 Tax=Embleya sp. NPDC008237 TaxID=3363978 RepID=UPI0036F101CF
MSGVAMSVAVVAAAAGAGGAVRGSGSNRRGRREPGRGHDPVWRRRVAALLGGAAVFVLFGGWIGGGVGVVVALALDRRLGRLEPRSGRVLRERLRADLPSAADLFAACLLAGSSPVEAAEAVAHAVGGPLAARLWPIVASLRLGGDPGRCWLGLTDDPVLAPLGRALARAATGGAPAAALVARMADEQRAEHRRAAAAAARRVGVRATVPLGLCFLPAFLLIGVVPIVIGLTTTLLQPF